MPNPWVSHVKQYAAANNTSYGCALSMQECKAAYKSKKEPTKTVTKKTKESQEPKPETKAYTMYGLYTWCMLLFLVLVLVILLFFL